MLPSQIGLTRTAPPATEPVTTAELKTWLGYGASDQDSQIASLITAAREWVEMYLRRQLITATWTLKLDGFPGWDVDLPNPPIQSITSITYVDTNGDSTVLSSSLYTVSTDSGRIAPAYNQSWPSVRSQLEPVSIVYVAGYGDDANDVPEQMQQAILLIAGSWWKAMQCGCQMAIPPAAMAMLSDRVLRI